MPVCVTEEELNDDFGLFGIPLDDPDVIDKLKELALSYRLESSSLCNEWIAFSQSTNSLLTLETLDQLEREKLVKLQNKTPNVKKGRPKIYDVNSIIEAFDEEDDDEEDDELLDSYTTPTIKKKRQHTPENLKNKKIAGLVKSPALIFSPSSFSPMPNTPSQKFGSRTNAGEVVASFGDAGGVSWRGDGSGDCRVTFYSPDGTLTKTPKHLFQKYTEKSLVLNDIIEDMAETLQSHHNIEHFSHIEFPVQEPTPMVGRVCCDSNGKLNAQSVLLEGSITNSGGKQVPLGLSEVQQYSLFPGQIVALDGLNTAGRKIVVSKVYEGVQLPFSDSDEKTEDREALQVMVAAGPFTTSDSLSYEPLADLVKTIVNEQPDVCILLGPFVDAKQELIANGQMEITFENLFKTHIVQLVKLTENLKTHIVLVPSQRDAHHFYVYPQPPFVLDIPKKMEEDFKKRVHCVPDPCTLVINRVVIGLTSTDILFHLGAEEISSPPGGSDRLARLARHLLTQQNYYPLYPPSEETCVDYELFEQFCKMPVTPDILVLPSDLRYFVKNSKGCLCINPGRVTKGQVGGTYSRFLVKPSRSGSIVDTTAAQVVRI